MHAMLSAKNAHAPVHVRQCNGAENSLPWKLFRIYFESCGSIVQAVVYHPPCYCLDESSRPTLFAQEIRPKSTLTHDAVAAAVLHKHHSIIRGSAGLIQFVNCLHPKLGHGAHPIKNSIFSIFRAIFLVHKDNRLRDYKMVFATLLSILLD